MRNKLLILLLIISVFASLFVTISSNNVSAAESPNGYRVEEIIRDKFNKTSLDSSWKLEGATLEHAYNALHCLSPVSYGSGPYINGARLSNKTRYEFTIYPQSVQAGANISFNIGMPNVSGTQTEPNVDCKIQLWEQNITFVDYQHNLQLPAGVLTTDNIVVASVNLYEETTDVAIVIERKGETLTEYYVEYRRNGSIVYTSGATPFKLVNPRYPNGYSGFFWDCLEMDMTNFRVYNDDELTFEDSFETNTITFGSQDPNLGVLHVVGLNASNCYFASINSVKMDSANEAIINSYSLTEQLNVTTPYQLSYSLKINELNANSFVGFGFGLSSTDSKIDAKNAIGFLRLDDTTAEIVAIRNGVVDRSNNFQINISKLALGKAQSYSVSLDAAHNAYLYISGQAYKFANMDFVGEIGVGLVDLGSSKSSSVELKEFSLSTNTYYNYSSEDVTNDFNGKVLSDDGYYYDPYINTQKFFVGPQVEILEDYFTGKVSALFGGAGSYSAFGVRKQYSEFICEFDFSVESRDNFQYLGFAFGKQSVVDVLTPSSTSSTAFLFRCDNSGAATTQILWGADCSFSNGTIEQPCDINIYDPEHTDYHMMVVAKNRNVYIYYKEADAPDSDLGILRAFIPNVNIDGYASVVGTNSVTFEVTNFKMINLSDACTDESAVTLREAFISKDAVSDKLEIDGFSKVKDGKLELNSSTVSTKMQYLYEIVRFTAWEVENNLQVKISGDKKIVFDVNNNKIKIVEGETTTEYDCSDANLKNIKGKRFEITIMGDEIKVGYKGYYDPQDKLSSTLFTHNLNSALTRNNISITSSGKAVIDDLYLFALDNSMRCETFNYEDDPASETVWEVKPDFDPSKVYVEKAEGCQSTITTAIVVLPMLVAACAFAFVKRNKKEDD